MPDRKRIDYETAARPKIFGQGITSLLVRGRFVKAFSILFSIAIDYLSNLCCYVFYRHVVKKSFSYKNTSLRYAIRLRHSTWVSERSLELSLFKYILDSSPHHNMIEIGNVLHNYYNCSHVVIDKYDASHNVIISDIMDYNEFDIYDLAISISTLEHIGLDESDLDDNKAIYAIEHILRLLKNGGKFIFSIPFGYNIPLDNYVLNNDRIDCSFFKRFGMLSWKQVDESELAGCGYEVGKWKVNAVIIGTIVKE